MNARRWSTRRELVETMLKLHKDLPKAKPPELEFHATCGPTRSPFIETRA